MNCIEYTSILEECIESCSNVVDDMLKEGKHDEVATMEFVVKDEEQKGSSL